MEKGVLMNEGVNPSGQPAWNSRSFGVGIQHPNELNCAPEQVANCFFNPTWEASMDQSDPFDSALSSMVSSPAASNAGSNVPSGEGVMIRELIGRLGNICNSADISPHLYTKTNNNNSVNTPSCASPMSPPPKLNLSMIDSQLRANFPLLGSQLSGNLNLAPFSADPGFADRAARLSCFGARNLGGLNGQLGLNETVLSQNLVPRPESAKPSGGSVSQAIKVDGSQVNGRDFKKNSLQDRKFGSDEKISQSSLSSVPDKAEFGDSREESSVSEQIPGGNSSMKGQSGANVRKRKSVQRKKAEETTSPSASDAKVATENDESSAKKSKQDEGSVSTKELEEANEKAKISSEGNQKQIKDNSKLPESPKDYIHVRARRGQATDSHSLAERVRREKISQRMKFLQDLVPGCNKVTGKAVMLDEIINYVQSLQRQVEFLSMKLATVNPRMDFNIEALLSKDICQSRGSLPDTLYPTQASTPAFPFGSQPQQGLPLLNGMPNNVQAPFSLNSQNATLSRNPSMQLPSTDGFADTVPQVPSLWEDDLQSIVQMGFGQNQPQSFNGSMASGQVKIEL